VTTNVVVTGLGTVSALGVGADQLAEALARGAARLTPIDTAEGFHRSQAARFSARVVDLQLKPWLKPMEARRMSPPSRFAVVAALDALQHAKYKVGKETDRDFNVCLSTAFGPTSFTQRLMDQIIDESPEAISPFLFTECVANAPAAQVAIHARASGANHTICEEEAGPLIVVGRGAADIHQRRARRALVGVAEEAPPLLHALLDRFDSLARATEALDEAPRPFDQRRNGLLLAEGATLLLLEDEDHARNRNAPILARLRGWGSAFDPSASRIGWGDGWESLAGSIQRGLRRFDVEIDEIDLIVSGASGACRGDRLEALTLNRLWAGRQMPPVIAPKATTGEYGGGFLAAAVLAHQGKPMGTDNESFRADPELGIELHIGRPPENLRKTLVTTLASGGGAAWLVLEAP